MTDQPRAYTRDEVRDLFLDTIHRMVDYWVKVRDPEYESIQRRLEGLAFSILVILDGESGLPDFKVIPSPHPDNQKFHQEKGQNWFPDDVNIAGELHEEFYREERKLNKERRARGEIE